MIDTSAQRPDAQLAEQLCRIEHKLDLLLEAAAKQDAGVSLRPVSSPEHFCPLCQKAPAHQINVLGGHVMRTCGCSTGIVPSPIPTVVAPDPKQQGSNNGGSSD